jgi:thiosulfate reductase cytochrome b subunit
MILISGGEIVRRPIDRQATHRLNQIISSAAQESDRDRAYYAVHSRAYIIIIIIIIEVLVVTGMLTVH